MIPPNIEPYLQDHLRGVRTAEETREILELIDQASPNENSRVAEFDNLLASIAKKIPGLAIDLEKLLTNDPIETDPLISQGNLALLRLDAVYHQAYAAWTTSGADLHHFKRITKSEDPAKYSQRTEKHERTEQNYPPDTQLLNQIVSITLSAFRIQATLTHRRNQLKNPDPPSTSPRGCLGSDCRARLSLGNQLPRQSAPSAQARDIDPDIIDHTESLTDQLDDAFPPLEEIKPIDGEIALIRGINKLSPLKGYPPLIQSQPTEYVPSRAGSRLPSSHSENQIVQEPTHPGPHAFAKSCTCSAEAARAPEVELSSKTLSSESTPPTIHPQRAGAEAANHANPTTTSPQPKNDQPREEEPVTPANANKVSLTTALFLTPSASPRSASPPKNIPLVNNEPNFHKRE